MTSLSLSWYWAITFSSSFILTSLGSTYSYKRHHIRTYSFPQHSIYPQLHLNHAWKWHWELLVQRRKTRHLRRFLIESYWFLLPQNLNLHVYHNWLEEKWNSTPLAPSPGPLPPAPEDGRDPVRLVGLKKYYFWQATREWNISYSKDMFEVQPAHWHIATNSSAHHHWAWSGHHIPVPEHQKTG